MKQPEIDGVWSVGPAWKLMHLQHYQTDGASQKVEDCLNSCFTENPDQEAGAQGEETNPIIRFVRNDILKIIRPLVWG